MKNKKFPALCFDSHKVKNKREIAQKDFNRDELTAFFLIRPFSIYISLFITNRTSISANSITFFMMFLSFFFPMILFFLNSFCLFLYLAPILFFILYALDMIDGEVARLRNKTSKLGEFYDASLWFTLAIYFVVYIYKICEFQNLPNILIIFSLTTIAFELFLLVSRELFCEKEVFDIIDNSNFRGKFLLPLKFILTKQNIYILYPLVIFFFKNTPYFNSYLVLFWILLLSIYNIYSVIKFNRIRKSINQNIE